MTKEILTKKRCGIILIIACCIYFIFNITIWGIYHLVTAATGAICTTAAFGLFLYFIREVSKEKDKEKINTEKRKE